MRSFTLTIAILGLLCTFAHAKPKTKTFRFPPKQVFEAALKATAEHHVVSYVDEARLMFTFETGKSLSSWGNRGTVSIKPTDGGNGAVMVVNTQAKSETQLFSWGAGGRLARDLFKWTEEILKSEPGTAQATGGKEPDPAKESPATAANSYQQTRSARQMAHNGHLVGIIEMETDTRGVRVLKLEPHGEAARAGLKPGTVIVEVDGKPVRSVDDLSTEIAARKPGATIDITYLYRYYNVHAKVVRGDESPQN